MARPEDDRIGAVSPVSTPTLTGAAPSQAPATNASSPKGIGATPAVSYGHNPGDAPCNSRPTLPLPGQTPTSETPHSARKKAELIPPGIAATLTVMDLMRALTDQAQELSSHSMALTKAEMQANRVRAEKLIAEKKQRGEELIRSNHSPGWISSLLNESSILGAAWGSIRAAGMIASGEPISMTIGGTMLASSGASVCASIATALGYRPALTGFVAVVASSAGVGVDILTFAIPRHSTIPRSLLDTVNTIWSMLSGVQSIRRSQVERANATFKGEIVILDAKLEVSDQAALGLPKQFKPALLRVSATSRCAGEALSQLADAVRKGLNK